MSPAQARNLAESPAATEQTLEALAGFIKRREVGVALAQNPNTPPTLMAKLMLRYPKECLANPSLPLIALESPFFLCRMGRDNLLPLLQRNELPAYLLSGLLTHPDPLVVELAAHHVALGELRPDWEDEAIRLLAQLPSSPWLRCVYRSRQLFPSWLWEQLPESARSMERPFWYLEPFVRFKGSPVADSRPVSHEELAQLRPNSELVLTTNRPAILMALAQKKYWEVALNPHCPPEALAYLVEKGPQDQVHCWSILSHPNTPKELLERFADDPACHSALASNPALPKELLERLLPELKGVGSQTALTTPQLLGRWQELSPEERTGFEHALLARQDCPLDCWLDILERHHENKGLAGFLNSYSHPDPQKRRQAGSAKDWSRRFGVALNQHTSRELLTQLTDDSHLFVRAAARKRLENPEWRFRLADISRSIAP